MTDPRNVTFTCPTTGEQTEGRALGATTTDNTEVVVCQSCNQWHHAPKQADQ